MKASVLVQYLNNEIRKHGDRKVMVIAYGDDEVVVEDNIVVVSRDGRTEIQVSRV